MVDELDLKMAISTAVPDCESRIQPNPIGTPLSSGEPILVCWNKAAIFFGFLAKSEME